MRPPHHRRLAEFILVAAIAFAIGTIVGAGGLFAYQQVEPGFPGVNGFQVQQVINPLGGMDATNRQNGSAQAGESPCSGTAPSLSDDGFFIVGPDGSLVRMEGVASDAPIDPAISPLTSQSRPRIAIRGQDLPLGSLHLIAYRAGIGVDITYGETGASINSVVQGSPAHVAGLQPGEVILLVNGDPVGHALNDMYVVGQHDLFGPMQVEITLEVVSGTTGRSVRLPRTYRNYTDEFTLMNLEDNVRFDLEAGADYVLLCPDHDLEPGTYGLEFREDLAIGVGPLMFGPTATPTPPPIPMPGLKWVFVVT